MPVKTYMNAIRDGIAEEMRNNPNVITMGEGIGERGGSYGHTQRLWKEFGAERVIDTPISENGFTAMAVGGAVCGLRPIVDLMFADIVYECMSQLAQQAAKLCYMSGGKISVPLVVRAQMGSRVTGPHHSACLYPLFMHIPGFKVVAPSNPYDAKGLMKAAIRDNNPVMFFEHKFAYNIKGEVPDTEVVVPIGKAKVVSEGSDVTVVAVSTMVDIVENMIKNQKIGADIELIDLRSLYPLDIECILKSVVKTGRLVVVEEAYPMCNAGAEIIAQITGSALGALKKPPLRVSALYAVHPYSPVLENAMLPNEDKIADAIKSIL